MPAIYNHVKPKPQPVVVRTPPDPLAARRFEEALIQVEVEIAWERVTNFYRAAKRSGRTGNLWTELPGGERLTVFHKPKGYKYCIRYHDGTCIWGNGPYESEEIAIYELLTEVEKRFGFRLWYERETDFQLSVLG